MVGNLGALRAYANRSASPCAGFEPRSSIDLVMKMFGFRGSCFAMVERILIVLSAASKTLSKSESIGMKNRCQLEWRRGSEIGCRRCRELVKTERWCFLKCERRRMAQTRRIGMQNEGATAIQCAEVFALPLWGLAGTFRFPEDTK